MEPAESDYNAGRIAIRYLMAILIGGALVIAPTVYSSHYINRLKEECLISSPLVVLDKNKWDKYYSKIKYLFPENSQYVDRNGILEFREKNGFSSQTIWIDAPYFGGISKRIVQINQGNTPIARFTLINASRITWSSLVRISDPEPGVACGSMKPEITNRLWHAFQN